MAFHFTDLQKRSCESFAPKAFVQLGDIAVFIIAIIIIS